MSEFVQRVDRWLSGWQARALWCSVGLALLAYLGFSWWSGGAEVWRAVQSVGVGGVLIALGLSLLNYGLRFQRWQMLLRNLGWTLATLASLRIYLAGFALTTTPGKSGEAVRSLLLRRHRVPLADSLAALVSERLSDVLAITILALAGIGLVSGAQSLIWAGAAGLVLCYVATAWDGWLPWLAGRGPQAWRRLLTALLPLHRQIRRSHTPVLYAQASLLSVLAWAAEAWAFHLLLGWMGVDLPWAFAFAVYALSMLAGALSFMPGGLGGAEAAMLALLVWRGVDLPTATAATVLIRFATLWFAVAIGVLALLAESRADLADSPSSEGTATPQTVPPEPCRNARDDCDQS